MLRRLEDAQRARRKGNLEPALGWLRGAVAHSPTSESVGELADLLAAQRRDLGLLEDLLGGLGWSRADYRGLDHLRDPALLDRQSAAREIERLGAHPRLPSLRALQLADDAAAAGDAVRAEQQLAQLPRRARSREPAERCYVRGKLALAEGDVETAALELASSAKLNAELARAHQWAGRALAALGDGRRAAEHFDRLMTLSTGHWYAPFHLSRRELRLFDGFRGYDVYYVRGKFFARPNRRHPEVCLEDHRLRGLVRLFAKELIRRARAWLRRALAREPVRRGFPELCTLLAAIEAERCAAGTAAAEAP